VLQLLIASLDAIHAGTGLRIVLIIRPHPKEDPEKFKNIKGRNTRIVLSTEGDSRDVVMAADLVTGISSTILIEACILGCIVASLQPGLMIRDILPTNRAGYTMLISRRDEMTPVLRDLLLNPVSRETIRKTLSTVQYDGNAARRVVELMCTMLHRKDSAFR
jgi:predicted glycosyltransferase